MSITDKIGKHYQTAIAGDMKKYHCDEWQTDIYFRSTYPFKDEARIIDLSSQGKVVEALVETLIVKARDASGKRLFTDADKLKLMNEADPKVIVKVCAAINSAKLEISQEQMAKE